MGLHTATRSDFRRRPFSTPPVAPVSSRRSTARRRKLYASCSKRLCFQRIHAGTAFVAKNGFRNDDFRPFLYRTTDYGRTWVSVAANLPESPINVVIQVGRLADGRCKLLSVSELTGMEGEVITMQEIFRFRQTGVTTDGIVQGKFEATGIRPRFLDQVMAHGITLSPDLFRPDAKFDA